LLERIQSESLQSSFIGNVSESTNHLRCPALDTFQAIDVFLLVWRPCLNTEFHVWSDIGFVQYQKFVFTKATNCFLIQPRIDLAFEAALVHCWLGFKLLVTITPKSLSSLVSSSFQTFPWVVILYSVLLMSDMHCFAFLWIKTKLPFI